MGKIVEVKTRDKTTLKGKLVGYDTHFNLMLSHLELRKVDGEKEKHNVTYVRGDGVVFIAAKEE